MNSSKKGAIADTKSVRFPNFPPLVDAGTNQTITLPTNSLTLSGTAFDFDGTIVSYLWTKASGPTSFNIVSNTNPTTLITGLVAGTYKFRLRVTDNRGSSNSDTTTVIVNPRPNQLPIVTVSSNQNITLPTNLVTVSGSATDPDGTISRYLWTKISGPASYNIVSPTLATTTINNLVAGVYVFQLTATDNLGGTGSRSTTITVNAAPPANIPPVANAGTDKNITLPTNSITQVGSGTDTDGTITSYAWTKLSGPATYTIVSPSLATTVINNLLAGTYVFQLTVTDNLGSTDTDTCTVIVSPVPNQLPIANAGIDQIITLPLDNITLTGSGTDPDGTISSYLWTKLSGPSATITSSTSATTTVTSMLQGVYLFQLQVTDNLGGTGVDTVQITVNNPPPPPPVAKIALSSAPSVPVSGTIITLPTSSVSLKDASTSVPSYPITNWSWTKISGTGGVITTPSASVTTITGLTQGNYVYQLQVWIGAPWNFTDTTTFNITVNPASPTGRIFYVDPVNGSDSNSVSQAQNPATPWRSWDKMASNFSGSTGLIPGDTVMLRGGTYNSLRGNGASIHFPLVGINGTSTDPITIQAYPGEVPVFNLIAINPTTYTYAMVLQDCSYIIVKGKIIVKNLKQIADGSFISRGFGLVTSHHCTVQFVEVFNMMGTGAFLEFGSNDNLFLNCDFHHNGDGLSDGGADAWDNSDGFSFTSNPSLPAETSTRNTLRYCRFWLNSDDGYDNFGTNGIIRLEGCWSFWNGYKPWGPSNNTIVEATMTPGNPSLFKDNPAYWSGSSNNGEGFKLGPARTQDLTNVLHYVHRCLAFENRGTGYASNSIDSLTGIHQLYNCTAYGNCNDGFSFGAGWCQGTNQQFKNNWAWNNNTQPVSGASWVYDGNNTSAISNNYWDTVYQGVDYGNLKNTIGQVTNADFLSVSSAGMDGARQVDGSLPVLNFLKLSGSSRLLNKGVNVSLPFTGSAPDLGCFES